ncbi:DUF4352 domain-containing protein [Salicibibacter cibarius]|uniref:DUF4352 domain-containing protein n=1 Tax=Salicibibacter cibarius TaxID=2743000 RepID=A0A7T6Z6D2_9BACI|nr:DUF4352 domain-containing protein [Salicibibacter cibarius]QQK77647.1 DUF4352 domain-containing protein [Salicibibacter cibarius]
MKTWTKIASAMFLSVALLVACGDGEEETTSEDTPDTDDDTSEAEDVEATEEEEESEEDESGNDASGDFEEDQHLTLGETGVYDTTIGTYEITLDSVSTEDEVEGEPPVNEVFIIAEVTIENISDEAVDAVDLAMADMMNDGETHEMAYWDYGFEGEEIEPGESLTGELIYDEMESSYYELVYGFASDTVANEVRWRFEEDEIDE